jgi:hypothetical protein
MNAKQRRVQTRHTTRVLTRMMQAVDQSIEKTYQHFKREVPKKVLLEIGDRFKAELHLLKINAVHGRL